MTRQWTNVVFDDGEAIAWCTHWHENAQEANDCPWRPEDPNHDVFIVHSFDFDPNACTPCVHEIHPAECLRCLALVCIHLNNPDECERCYGYQRLLQGPHEDPDAGNGAGTEATERPAE